MNASEENKKELDDIMKDVPASSIALVKEAGPAPKVNPDINAQNQLLWGNKSNRLLTDYKYGENLALYGENNYTVPCFFKRLSVSLCAIISNEYQKRSMGAEHLKPYYNILESCMNLISKEIEKNELKEQDVSSIIASLHGFITNYNQRKETK